MSGDDRDHVREFQNSLAELVDLPRRFRMWVEEHNEGIKLFLGRLTAFLEEYDRYHSEREAADFALLATGGWVGLERHFCYQELRSAADICRSSGTDAMNDAVLRFFSDDDCAALGTVLGNWPQIPYLSERETIIRDAVSAHKAGQFTLSIPAMLPIAEGLAAELLGTPDTNAVKIVAAEWKKDELEAWSQEFWNVVDSVVYKKFTPGKSAAPYLNRHAILHGRVADYANACNSLRVFLLIDVLVGIWEKKQGPVGPAVSNLKYALGNSS